MIQAQAVPVLQPRISHLWALFTMERRTWVAVLVVGCGVAYGLGIHNYQQSQAAIKDVSHQVVVANGKLAYHRATEKVLAKTAATTLSACEHNLNAALNNDAGDVRGCPPAPPVLKAIVADPATK